MTTTPCARCGTPSAGNFCAQCGAALTPRSCTGCGSPIPPGSRFCTQCGASVAAHAESTPAAPGPSAGAPAPPTRSPEAATGGTPPSPHPAWWMAGGLLILLIVVVAWPILRPADVAPLPQPASPGGAPAVDLASMTPREAADALFDRVMRAASSGDSAQVAQFVPMAIMAYDRARPLDSDGRFHLASMQHLSGDFAGALETVAEGLAAEPGHLLLLHAGGQAAVELGDTAAARRFHEEVLAGYDAGLAQRHPDYEAHRELMPTVRAEAAAWLAANGG